MTHNKTSHALIAASMLALALTGCGDKEGGDEKKAETQVAAKVNDTEITVHQINHVVSRLGNVPADKAQEASNQVLRGLVDQELLVQAAAADKLDRDPTVVQSIEAARKQLLAQAYIERKAGSYKPADAEVQDYYAKHPEMFSERRIYQLQEIAIQAKPENAEAIRANLTQSKTLQDFAAWLKSQNIPYRAGGGVKPAEQIPAEILPRLHQLKDGQALTVNAPGGIVVMLVTASRSQPVTAEHAKASIEQIMVRKQREETVKAEVKRLKDAGKIEYVGAFVDAGKEPAAAPAAPEAAAPAAAPDAAKPDLEKGLSGL
jgi:EpsD family peptidyl-prolyl cis-trans isomerase